MQYATEKNWKRLELRVYAGANGDFVLYEDENDNYNYERGLYSEIPLHWDDASKTLTIGARKGTFPGMLKSRKFVVRLAGTDVTREVSYNGALQKVKMP